MRKFAVIAFFTFIVLGTMSFSSAGNFYSLYHQVPPAASADSTSPIDGNWILVTTLVNGKMVPFQRNPAEFKMFHDGYFSFLTYDADGKFDYAGAGPFTLDKDRYTEKFAYCSLPDNVGGWNMQGWSFSGDTLVFTGYEKMQGPTGKDMMPVMGKDTIVEKRIRAK